MNSIFLSLPKTQRQRAIQEAALRRGISPIVMEKDFWVCYIVSMLFRCKFGDSLVFKGGTSLSKVFGAINRFSEDIDKAIHAIGSVHLPLSERCMEKSIA
jgi:predicted nucleotidyltransferase component of viral defense system